MDFTKLIEKSEKIVFDLGGVILDISPQRTARDFVKAGIPDFEEVLSGKETHDFFADFERGKLSADEFRSYIKKLARQPLRDETIDLVWNQTLLDYTQCRIDAVRRCAQTKEIYLLSNTNQIHFEHFGNKTSEFGTPHLSDLFIKAYYSHHVGMRKPDAEIFEFLIAELNCKAEDILFLDDNIHNINSAKNLGINTIHISNGIDITQLF